MKNLLLKIWLPRLALYLADNNKNVIALISDAIASAETRFPAVESNSHRTHRFSWAKDRVLAYLPGKEAWIINVVMEMLVAYARVKKGNK